MMLDTTFLVDLVRGDPGARAFLQQAERGSEALRLPAPAIAKFWEAMERSRAAPRDVERVRVVLAAMPSAALDAAAAMRAGRILGAASREGWTLDVYDALVAAIAVEADETLVTRAARDYERVDGLRLATY